MIKDTQGQEKSGLRANIGMNNMGVMLLTIWTAKEVDRGLMERAMWA